MWGPGGLGGEEALGKAKEVEVRVDWNEGSGRGPHVGVVVNDES